MGSISARFGLLPLTARICHPLQHTMETNQRIYVYMLGMTSTEMGTHRESHWLNPSPPAHIPLKQA